MSGNKIYRFKGHQFRISEFPKPAEDSIPYFTSSEWTWIKTQNLGPEEFYWLCKQKLEDHIYDPVPEKDKTNAAKWAQQYGTAIINQLKGISKADT